MTDQPAPKPHIAARQSIEVELEAGKTYYFCACGLSENQPFCDGKHKGSGMKSLPFTAEKTGKAWLCRCKHSAKIPFCDGTHSKI